MPAKKIFLASSSELKDDRKDFEIFINRKNKEWHDKGVFLELIVWEDFLDAVSKTRLQDEYNKAIRECDIFVMLFFTKVGKYTEEEFETAFGQFKSTSKPFIFTYFKDVNNSVSNTEDAISLQNFKNKLNEFGHFYKKYSNVESLQLNFNQQLEKLVAKRFIEFTQPGQLSKELNNKIPKTHPADIIGREKDLEALHDLLYNDKRVVVVNGLGGIGKTTLVQAYVHQYYDDYAHLLWITQSADNIINDFINAEGLLRNLEIETANTEPTQLFSEVIRKLKSIPEKPNLLVVDNAEQSLKKYKNILPTQPQWHLLATSREEITGFYLKPIDFLNEEQSIALFKKHYTHKKLSDNDVKELVKAIDYHTLTIEILAKTAEVQRYDVNTLKNAIEKDLKANIEVSRQSADVEKIGAYLSTVFNMSKMNESEIWLMKQFACLPPEFLSYDVLYELTTGEDSLYKETFSETITAIAKKGWLLYNAETDSYKMHRIITGVVKKQHAISIDDVNWLIHNITYKLRIDQAKDNPVDRFIWVSFGRTLLNIFAEDGSGEISTLQNNLAIVLQNLSDYEEAKSLLEKVVASYEKNFGKDHASTARSYSNLATVLQNLGDYEEAKFLLEKVVASDEKNFGKEHSSTARSYSNLALVLQNLGDYEGAKPRLEKAMASNENNFGKDDPTTAISYSNLALVLKDLGDYQGAKFLLEKAVASDEKNFGKDHPSRTRSYSNLALVLQALGDYEGAKSRLEKAVASDEKNFGKDHPFTAGSYSNLALVLQNLGNYEGARFLLEKAMASNEKNLGKDHPTTAVSYFNLAGVLQDLGDYKQALYLSGKALAILKHALPAGHPDIKTVEEIYQSIKKELDEQS